MVGHVPAPGICGAAVLRPERVADAAVIDAPLHIAEIVSYIEELGRHVIEIPCPRGVGARQGLIFRPCKLEREGISAGYLGHREVRLIRGHCGHGRSHGGSDQRQSEFHILMHILVSFIRKSGHGAVLSHESGCTPASRRSFSSSSSPHLSVSCSSRALASSSSAMIFLISSGVCSV